MTILLLLLFLCVCVLLRHRIAEWVEKSTTDFVLHLLEVLVFYGGAFALLWLFMKFR